MNGNEIIGNRAWGVRGAILALALITLLSGAASADTITVCSVGCDNTTIQGAVNVANEGDTIYVYNGTYNENVMIGTDNLTLTGEGRDVVIVRSPSEWDDVIHVLGSDYVNISGFTSTGGVCGIYILNSDYSNISSNNICENVGRSPDVYGIYLCGSDHNMIAENHVDDNQREPGDGEGHGYGIYLDESNANTLINNTADGNTGEGGDVGLEEGCMSGYGYGYGIYLSDSNDNVLIGNTANENEGIGGVGDCECYSECRTMCWDELLECEGDLQLCHWTCEDDDEDCHELCDAAYDCDYDYEDCIANCATYCSSYQVAGYGYGIYIWDSKNNTFSKNIVNENQGNENQGYEYYGDYDGHGCGIYISYSTLNNITCNWIYGNTHRGLCLRVGSTENNISCNNIIENGVPTANGYHYQFCNFQSNNVNATDNWWGTGDNNLINESIYDDNDHSGYGVVTYLPKKPGAVPCAPIPELVTLVLLSVGILAIAGYSRIKREK